jgi:hypothetical protein
LGIIQIDFVQFEGELNVFSRQVSKKSGLGFALIMKGYEENSDQELAKKSQMLKMPL